MPVAAARSYEARADGENLSLPIACRVDPRLRRPRQGNSLTAFLGTGEFLATIGNRGGQSGRRHITPQQTADPLAQLLYSQVTFDLSAHSQAYRSGFLGNNDRDRISFFGDANAGAVPRSKLG